MKKSFQRVIATQNLFQGKQSLTIFLLAAIFALTACGDDDSSSPKGTGLPAEVADMEELETYGCGMDVIGEKVYVADLELNYECDGEKWFKSYDQTKPSSTSTKSSSSKKSDDSSDSKAADKDGSSSSDATTSSSSAKSSSSRPTEILEPEITVNETCTEVGACDAMVKTDISTWHFVRKDGFDRDMEYIYFVEGTQLMVKTIDYKGVEDIDTLKVYSDMTNEISQEYAFNAAKSTCKNGGGNDNKIKSCVKDTVKALPECNASREGVVGKKDSLFVICKKNTWINAKELEIELKSGCSEKFWGEIRLAYDSLYYVCNKNSSEWKKAYPKDMFGKKCTDNEIGNIVKGITDSATTAEFYCSAKGWIDLAVWSWDVPKEVRLNKDIEYGEMIDKRDGKKYKTVTIGKQVWMAQNLNYSDSVKTPSLKGKSWCYDDDEKNCEVTGRYYIWGAAIDSVKLATDKENPQICGRNALCDINFDESVIIQGICPDGWRLPNVNDAHELFTYGNHHYESRWLGSQTGWAPTQTDSYGFSALPSGYRGGCSNCCLDDEAKENYWGYVGQQAELFTSTKYGDLIRSIGIGGYTTGINTPVCHALPVRCLKDSD